MSAPTAVVSAAPPGAMAALPIVVRTKLVAPRVRPGLVERERLVELLRGGRERTLTLVCAPAGYGKSTLLAQWAEADREVTPFVWVSLEPSDSDPVRLWAHLVSGLREVHPSAGEASLGALRGGAGAIGETLVPLLVRELADAPDLVVILDDWHLVRNPVCDATMTSFVEHTPEAVQVVVSSRADPGLSVARLRAHGRLAEIRESTLRVSTDEAHDLFRRADVELERQDVERVNERAEGWLAGICLALLVARERPDRERFVDEFSADTRHVLDFLAEDVLAATSPDVRTFLLRTSVLDRLSAELCDAVLDASNSAALLAEIASANLFLVPLDDAGREYRYHHLFAAMLERELAASDPSAPRHLHARASEWLEAHGDVEAAIEHAIASGDVARASDLVTVHGQPYWAHGRVATVARWLDALSWAEAAADPQLALMRATINGLSGRSGEEIERWLGIAEAAHDFGPLANGMDSLHSGVALLRAAFLTRGIAAAVNEARSTLERQAPDSAWRGQALGMLGQALYLEGRFGDARTVLEEARALPGATARAPATIQTLSYLSLIALDEGDAPGSERLARGALELIEERHLGTGIVAVNAHIALGCVLAASADLHSAVEHLRRAADLAAPAGSNYWHAHALVRLVPALRRLGDAEAANAALQAARADLDALPEAGMLEPLYAAAADALSARARREGFRGDDLSEAELRIVRALSSGASLNQVARDLYLSPNTVKTHRRSIYRKLGITTREELVQRAASVTAPTVDAARR